MDTDRFPRSPLYIGVYCKDKEGKPISWTRIYPRTMRLVQRVCQCLDEYYGRPERKPYICIKDLAVEVGMKDRNLSSLLRRMACWREIWYRDRGQFKLLRKNPYVLLMQKAKFQHPKWWNKVTPVMVFPFDRRFFHFITFDDVIDLR